MRFVYSFKLVASPLSFPKRESDAGAVERTVVDPLAILGYSTLNRA